MIRQPLLVASSCLWILAPAALAQQTPLERTFSVGATYNYRVQLTVRSELEAQRPVKIGIKMYVERFSRFAEARVAWEASRRVASVTPDGPAEVEETLDRFSDISSNAAPGDEEAEKLRQTLHAALEQWAKARTLRYREAGSGQVLDLKPDGVPVLDEGPPPLLALWLLRALRPVVSLPARPIIFGARWHERRAVQLEQWTDVLGTESGEWLPAETSPEPAARLHTVQQIGGIVSASPVRDTPSPAAGADKVAESRAKDNVATAPAEVEGLTLSRVEGRFHAESLTTVSLGDARVLAATRSAARDVIWTLAGAKDMTEPPRFRGRLSVQVQIEEAR